MANIEKELAQLQKLYDRGDHEKAALLADELAGDHPTEPKVFQMKAFLLQGRGLYKESAVSFDRAIELNPRDPDTLYMSAFNHLQLGNWKRVVSDCTAGLELGSEYHSDGLLLFRAEALISLGRKTEARADLKRVVWEGNVWTYKLRTKRELLSLCS